MDKETLKSLLITPNTTVKEAIQRLNETARKILFVVDGDEKLIGTLTDGDIRRGIISGLQLSTSSASVMKHKFIGLSNKTPGIQQEARRLMQEYLIEYIPIQDERGIIIDVIQWVDYLADENTLRVTPAVSHDNPVVIMAGGKGTRLDPFTKILPKPLIPLGDKPIIENIMDRFYANGFSRFILIVNYKKEMIKAYFSDKSLPYSITFVEENEFYGTAGGMYLLKDMIKLPFIVTNCDTILEGSYDDFYQWHCDHKNIMTIVGSHKEIVVPYGVLCMNNGFLDKIDEKPKLDIFINTGTYLFEPEVFDFIQDKTHLDMDKLIHELKKNLAEQVGVYPHWGGWYDIGQWDEYRKSLKALSNV